MQYKELDDKAQSYPASLGICSTPIISSDTVATEKRKPRLAGQGLRVAVNETITRDDVLIPSLPYSAINDNSHGLLGAESVMNYQPAGFVKIPRSLLSHHAWLEARPKHQFIFLQFLLRATWSPTVFYWNGHKIELKAGQFYFTRRKLAEELSRSGDEDDKISDGDIRGAMRYFEKVNFLTQHLTHGITNGPTVITISFSGFCVQDSSVSNQLSNPPSNGHLTHTSPTKEEDKEHKEEKKKEKKKGTAVAAPSLSVLKIEKVQLRESVTLSQTEIDTAKSKFGDELFEAMCDCLNSYKISKGKEYKSDYGLFIRGGWLVSAGKKLLQEEKAPTAQTDKNTSPRQETLGSILNDFDLGAYYYSSKFGEFKLFSPQGYCVFEKSTSDLAGIRAGLKASKLERIRD